MPNAPELTIVVPVWNAGEFLPVCLASIEAQTFPGWRCVLVDDGSTDGSGPVCDEWAARDSRFSVIHKENGGASSARNAGLAAADTPWVYFFDADDAMAPCLLEAALSTQKQYPRDLAIWRSTSDWEEYQALPGMPRSHRRCTKEEMQLIFLQIALHTGVNTKLFRRDILTEHGFSFVDPDGRKNAPGEDALFSTRYMGVPVSGRAALLLPAQQPQLHHDQPEKIGPRPPHRDGRGARERLRGNAAPGIPGAAGEIPRLFHRRPGRAHRPALSALLCL